MAILLPLSTPLGSEPSYEKSENRVDSLVGRASDSFDTVYAVEKVHVSSSDAGSIPAAAWNFSVPSLE